MKKISVMVPCFNEERSINLMHKCITNCFSGKLKNYDYEIIFVDNYSEDNSRKLITQLCEKDPKTKAIFNARNFGFARNIFYALIQGTGDAVFLVFGDMQDPPELITDFVEKWEHGDKVILGQKLKSDESKVKYFFRSMYYKIMDKHSLISQIPHYTGFGLYDQSFIEILRNVDDPQPYLKGLISELGMKQSIVNYTQKQSMRGKSNFSFMSNYDLAMMGITSYTKSFLRLSTFAGIAVGTGSLIIAIITFINKLINWNSYELSQAATTIGIFFLGAVQLFFIGILGEYVLSINSRIIKKPLIVEEKRINFDDEKNNKSSQS